MLLRTLTLEHGGACSRYSAVASQLEEQGAVEFACSPLAKKLAVKGVLKVISVKFQFSNG